jgi:hypothetical protein
VAPGRRRLPEQSQYDESQHYEHTHLVKDILQPLLREGRTLDVLYSAELLCEALTLFRANRTLPLSGKLLNDLGIVSQVYLCTDDQAGDTGAMMVDLWEPLFLDVFKRSGRCDAEADEKDVGLGIRKGTKSIIILLA